MSLLPKKVETRADLEAMIPGTALAAMKVGIETIDDVQAVLTMPIDAATRQPAGLLHGGMTMFLIESAASMHACWGIDLSRRAPVGIEINASHLRAVTDGTARAVARVVRRSGSFIVHQVDVHHAESGALISTGRVTSYYVRTGSETPA